MHGWLILDKPVGLGSTQAVSAVKRALREGGYAKRKVGHGGTLDPLASGVLPVAIGEATKLAGRMLDSDKIYDFTIRFGVETDTLDLEGREVATSDVRPTAAQVAAVLPRFTGPIEQVPPAYSALKVDGERAYDLARKGEDVTLASRSVTIHDLQILPELGSGRGTARSAVEGREGSNVPRTFEDRSGNDPTPHARHAAVAAAPLHHPLRGRSPSPSELGEERLDEITLTAHVSKGTYIRSLARDIARALGTVGHVTLLHRVKAGPFTLESAISLDKLADAAKGQRLEDCILPLRAGLDDIPALSLTPDQAGLLRQGQVLIGTAVDDGLHFALLDDVPVALVEAQAGQVRVVRGFNL